MNIKSFVGVNLVLLALGTALGCTPQPTENIGQTQTTPPATPANAGTAQGTGTLAIYANGEERLQEGFTSKDGWALTFSNVYVTFADVTAYQTNPPYESTSGAEIKAQTQVSLDQTRTVDLVTGNPDNPTVLVGEISNAPAGHYNALAWRMVPATTGAAQGYVMTMNGTARKDGRTVNFAINLEPEFAYRCGEYVGDERRGVVQANDTASLEATFHFDHLFGEGSKPANDPLNVEALGFEPIAALAQNGEARVTLAQLRSSLPAADYQRLEAALPALGHVGEGHCYEARSSTSAS